jgi:Na+-translocating ferredoxin:NAD+ oxidoreductase RnfD subunit
MATDPVTSPLTRAGKYVAGALCGLLTVLIRSFSGFTEGVMFSILLTNALNPLIDHAVLKAKYRSVKG